MSQATSDNRVSVWILGDQLLAQHPALLAAEQGHAPENVRVVFPLLELLLYEATLRANPRLGRRVLGLRHLDEGERGAVRQQATDFLDRLDYGESTPR